MGYNTHFDGQFAVTPKLSEHHKAYLERFSSTRRVQYSAKIWELNDTLRELAKLPKKLEYFVGIGSEDGDFTVVKDYNNPPQGQPGLWCHWTPSQDGTCIEWDGGEKFYDYTEWLGYIIEHFLAPWGYKLNGEVTWEGDESSDFGKIVVKNNKIKVKFGKRVYT